MAKRKDDIVRRALETAADRARARADRENLEARLGALLKALSNTKFWFGGIVGTVLTFMEESGEQWDHPQGIPGKTTKGVLGLTYHDVRSSYETWDYYKTHVADIRVPDACIWPFISEGPGFHLSSARGIPPPISGGWTERAWINRLIHTYTFSVVEHEIVATIRIAYTVERYDFKWNGFYQSFCAELCHHRVLQRDFTKTYDAASVPDKLHTQEQMVRLVDNLVSDAQRDLLFAPDHNTCPSGYIQTCNFLTETGWKAGQEQWGGAFTPPKESPIYQWWRRFLKWMES